MTETPFSKSMMDLLAHIRLPAADSPPHGAEAAADPQTPLAEDVAGPHAVLDRLLAEVEHDLRAGHQQAATTALGLVGTRVSLDAMRGAPPPPHVEWLAAHLRTAAAEMALGHPGKALKAVRRARLALR